MNGEQPSTISPAEGGGDEAEKIRSVTMAFLKSAEIPRSLIDDWEEMRADEEYCKAFSESLSEFFGAYMPMISFAMNGASRLKIGEEFFSALAYDLFKETSLGDNANIVQGVIAYLGQNPSQGTSIDGEQIIIIRDFFEESTEFAEDLIKLMKGQE